MPASSVVGGQGTSVYGPPCPLSCGVAVGGHFPLFLGGLGVSLGHVEGLDVQVPVVFGVGGRGIPSYHKRSMTKPIFFFSILIYLIQGIVLFKVSLFIFVNKSVFKLGKNRIQTF